MTKIVKPEDFKLPIISLIESMISVRTLANRNEHVNSLVNHSGFDEDFKLISLNLGRCAGTTSTMYEFLRKYDNSCVLFHSVYNTLAVTSNSEYSDIVSRIFTLNTVNRIPSSCNYLLLDGYSRMDSDIIRSVMTATNADFYIGLG